MGTPIKGVGGDVWAAASPSLALGAPESMTDSGDHIVYTANIHKYWDKRTPVVVQVSPNGSTGWATVTDYTFRYVGGVVTFNTARVVGTNNFVRINTGNYFNVAQAGDCNDWSLDLGGDVTDTTVFQSPGGWKTKTPTTKGGSGKLSTFRFDDLFTKELGNLLVFVLYADKTANTRWEMYGYVTGVVPKNSATGVVTQEASYVVDGDAFYWAS
jgi:hypothetical protein